MDHVETILRIYLQLIICGAFGSPALAPYTDVEKQEAVDTLAAGGDEAEKVKASFKQRILFQCH